MDIDPFLGLVGLQVSNGWAKCAHLLGHVSAAQKHLGGAGGGSDFCEGASAVPTKVPHPDGCWGLFKMECWIDGGYCRRCRAAHWLGR